MRNLDDYMIDFPMLFDGNIDGEFTDDVSFCNNLINEINMKEKNENFVMKEKNENLVMKEKNENLVMDFNEMKNDFDLMKMAVECDKIRRRNSRVKKNIYRLMQEIDCDGYVYEKRYCTDGKLYRYLKYGIVDVVRERFGGDLVIESEVVNHRNRQSEIRVCVTIRGVRESIVCAIEDCHGNACYPYSSELNKGRRFNASTGLWEEYVLAKVDASMVERNRQRAVVKCLMDNFGLGVYLKDDEIGCYGDYVDLLRRRKVEKIEKRIERLKLELIN